MQQRQNIFFVLIGFLAGAYMGFALLGFFFLPRTQSGAIEFHGLSQQVFAHPVFLGILLIGGTGSSGAFIAYALATKKTLKESARNLSEAQEVNKTKDEFISMVLHHLRTPLSGIRWSIKEILKEVETTNPLRKHLEVLNGENMRALTAVEHLVEASQASMGRIEYFFKILPVDKFLEVLKKSIEGMKARAEEKALTMNIELHAPSKASLKVDETKVAIVVQTLIENAIQYTPRAGAIAIRTEEKDFNFFFHITDTGIGIPLKEQTRIFLQFFRGKEARRIEPGGFGIGLYVAKIFIENHKGEIGFISEKEKGTTFTFRLPTIIAPTEKLLEQIG